MTEHQFNANFMFGQNNVDDIVDFLSIELCQFTHGEACRINKSKVQQIQQHKLATANIEVSKARQKKQEASQWQAAEQLEQLRASNPVLDLGELQGTDYNDLHVDRLKEQLLWHWEISGDKEIPKAISSLKKADLQRKVLTAIKQWTQKSALGGMSFDFNQS